MSPAACCLCAGASLPAACLGVGSGQPPLAQAAHPQLPPRLLHAHPPTLPAAHGCLSTAAAGCHNNLWSNIDLGLGNRAFLSSGGGMRGAHAGALRHGCGACKGVGQAALHQLRGVHAAAAAGRGPAAARAPASASARKPPLLPALTHPTLPPHPASPHPAAAANNTWWNIRASTRPKTAAPIKLRECTYGPLLNFLGSFYAAPAKGGAGVASTATPSRLFPGYCTAGVKWWVEQLRPGAAIFPADLFGAMVETRAKRLGTAGSGGT